MVGDPTLYPGGAHSFPVGSCVFDATPRASYGPLKATSLYDQDARAARLSTGDCYRHGCVYSKAMRPLGEIRKCLRCNNPEPQAMKPSKPRYADWMAN